ncbi:MAG: transglycosylase SLT domain-containing protein [Xenococcaceae cyanobacterium]
MLRQQKSTLDRKKLTNTLYLFLGSGLVLLGSACLIWAILPSLGWFSQWQSAAGEEELDNNNSAVLSLTFASVQQRQPKLQAIASGKEKLANASLGLKFLDRTRARYLLANDLLKNNQPQAALEQLKNLEKEYPTLAPYILLKQAQARESLNRLDRAKFVWQQIRQDYPESAAIAATLYRLGRFDSQHWDTLLDRYPYSPYAQKIVRQRLKDNSDRVDLLLLQAKYNREEDTTAIKDRLFLQYASQLKPEDWEAIALGYWQNKEHRKAADAYLLSRLTPRNLFRAARGFEQNGNKAKAIETYQKLYREFHDAQETGLGLLRLASLSSGREALDYFEEVIKKFPSQAPSALQSKIIVLNALNKQNAAAEAEQLLLQNYSNSEAALNYRWSKAKYLAAKKDYLGAWQWLQPIVQSDIESDLLAEVSFWAGKWAMKIDRPEDAKIAFKNAIARYPESYYAWRSAVMLGLPVGDFTTVRQMSPQIQLPSARLLPLAGSETFKELFRLGQDEDAWNLLLAEYGDRQHLSIEEQFTEGEMLIALGKPRKGILLIRDLKNRDSLQDRSQLKALRQNSKYWLTLFPFPFQKYIFDSSKENEINPLLTVSLIRQESGFQTKIDSFVGAAGLMQLMPDTARWIAEQIKFENYSLDNPEDNIKIGTAYLSYLHRTNENNSLVTVASYNAGGANVAKWTKNYSLKEPDILVNNIPFPETKDYVESVFGNYWNYLRIYNPEVSRLVSGVGNRE